MFRSYVSFLLLVLLGLQAQAQNYIPKSLPFTTCPAGQRLITLGNNNVTATDVHTPGSSTSAISSSYLYTTPVTVTEQVMVYQLSFGILDNIQISSVVHLRLALVHVSSATSTTSAMWTMVAQSDEILLYASNADIIYVNFPNGVLLEPWFKYAIGVWSDGTIYTGMNNLPAGTTPNAAYSGYTLSGLPTAAALSYTYGTRAVQATGCSVTNPFTEPGAQTYAVCATFQATQDPPSPVGTSYTYTRSTWTWILSGMVTVSATGGTSAAGEWRTVTAAAMTMTRGTDGYAYYPSWSVTTVEMQLFSTNSKLFVNGNPSLDEQGITFVGGQEQVAFTFLFTNNSYSIMETGPGVSRVVPSLGTTFSITRVNSPNDPLPSCSVPQTYVPDTLTCDSGDALVTFGDSDATDAQGLSFGSGWYAYGNFMWFREFTATLPNTVLRQLTYLVANNTGIVAKLRMGVYTSTGAAYQYPTYSLLAQTREVTLSNVNGLITVNLLSPLTLVQGQNYSIGVTADQGLYTYMGSQMPAPYWYGMQYDALTTGGSLPATTATTSTYYVLPVGANACAKQQTTKQVQICATYVYPTYTDVFTGVLTVLSTPQSSSQGSYYAVISGSGQSTRTSSAGVVTTNPFTVHNYYLPTNNRLYVSGANGGMAVDQNGISIVVAAKNAGYAVQMSSWLNPASAVWEYKQNTQSYASTGVSFLNNLGSVFTYSDYNGGALATCTPPARPVNSVVPASVARAPCPFNDNSIQETLGDANVGDYSTHAEGTTIAANKIYTTSFTARTSATARQVAVGLLKNVDKTAPINVFMGIYSATGNNLLAQTQQLTLTQVVDQVIVMSLTSAVTLNAGQTYYIALIASAPLEIATSSVSSTSPSMSMTFASTGLPATFAATSTSDVAVSVAAYVCVSTTHSFCSYYQYYSKDSAASVTMLYQGLLQADTTQQSNSYGSFVNVNAVSGRLTTYYRSTAYPVSTQTVVTFVSHVGATAQLYMSSANQMSLDSTGWTLDLSNGATSKLFFDSAVNKIDETSRGGADKDTNLVYSGFSVQAHNGSIPACSLQRLPYTVPAALPAPTCPSGEQLVVYGDAETFDLLGSNVEGSTYALPNTLYMTKITTHPTRATSLSQFRIPLNDNFNLIMNHKFGLYDSNYNFLGGTNVMTANNVRDSEWVANMNTPQYLAPNSVYYLAWWTDSGVFTGFLAAITPGMTAPFSKDTWPAKFVYNYDSSPRQLAGYACTTALQPSNGGGGGGGGADTSSSSNGRLADGSVAGIVIGCVIGTNLLLLACVYLFCFAGASAGKGTGKGDPSYSTESSRMEQSQVELSEA